MTPEDGFSYASYEANGFDTRRIGLDELARRVAGCFGPSEFSIAVTCGGGSFLWAAESHEVDGFGCQKTVTQELPGGTCVVYKTYERTASCYTVPASPALAAAKQCREAADEEEEEVGGGERMHFPVVGQLELAQ